MYEAKINAEIQRNPKEKILTSIPAKEIVTYLTRQANVDTELGIAILNPNKVIFDCLRYVLNCVKKQAKSSSFYVPDQVVYDYAVEYYKTTNYETEQQEKKRAEVSRAQNTRQTTYTPIPTRSEMQVEEQTLF